MLLHFPNEIAVSILLYLDGEDLKSTRLICNHISQLAFPIFLQRYFTKVETGLQKQSIERLESIASSPIFQNAVLELRIDPRSSRFGHGLRWPRTNTWQLKEGPDLTRIRRILTESFPNCTKISIYADEGRLWPNYWRSEEYLTLLDVIGQTFVALAHASTTTHRIESFALNISEREPSFGLLSVNPSTYESKSFWHAWSKLTSLRLDMAAEEDATPGILLAAKLITNSYGLKKLALKFCFQETHPGQYAFYNVLMAAETLPKLSHLVLSQMDFASPEKLLSFLRRFKTSIQLLSLYRVSIYGDWKRVCRGMRGLFPRIKCLILSWPLNAEGMFHTKHFYMCSLPTTVPNDAKKYFSFTDYNDFWYKKRYVTTGVRYTGSNLNSALELIEESLYSTRIPPGGLEPYIPTPDPNRVKVSRFSDPNTEF